MTLETLLSRIEELPTGCWRYRGTHLTGTDGTRRPVAANRYVYRVLYVLFRGPLGRFPEQILHHVVCGHTWCANPWHTAPMTQSRHAKLHGRGGDQQVGHASRTHCPAGHSYDARNTYVQRTGHRQCRLCKAASQRAYYARSK